jgi:hypothetical protein
MKNIFCAIVLLMICFSSSAQSSNGNDKPIRKIGIFAPLYLDSVFHGTDYKYWKKFPRFTLQGLDFVQGAKIALDSFPINNCIIETFFYDSKSDSLSIDSLIKSHQLDSLELIIGSVKDDEINLLADFAKSKKIPFISATYPNDAGVTANPYYIILSSTLKSHCESIFSYILQNHSTDKILLLRKTGSQEDRVAGYINGINKQDGKSLLYIKTVKLDSNVILIKNSLDSTRKNIIIGGSLDEEFATSLSIVLNSLSKKYDITLIGMPNWEGFGAFGKKLKPELKDFPIYFTSPYYNTKSDNYSKVIQDVYLKKYKGSPSDFAYKGFEITYVFSRLLNMFPTDIMSHLNDYSFKVFSEYNLSPIKFNPNSLLPDYLENKHLYFLKKINGVTSKAW